MNYENLSKDELINIINKLNETHNHVFENLINTTEHKLIRTCSCGYVENVDLTTLENPNHSHSFEYSTIKSKYDEDTKIYTVKYAVCKTCGESRVYLTEHDMTDELINELKLSSKYEVKYDKTQVSYPKLLINIISFYIDNKVFYVKTSTSKWYIATSDMTHYIMDNFEKWTEETGVLFKVYNGKIQID